MREVQSKDGCTGLINSMAKHRSNATADEYNQKDERSMLSHFAALLPETW